MGDAALGVGVNVYNHDSTAVYMNFADMMVDDQGTAADGDNEGAMPNWVPTFAMAFPGSGAPNWMTAYPTIVYRLWQFTGDAALVKKHWPQLQSYLNWYKKKLAKFPKFDQNPFRRTQAGTISATAFPGDWCPAPKVRGQFWNDKLNRSINNKHLGENECGAILEGLAPASEFPNRMISSAFAYLKDSAYIAEMGNAIGIPSQGVTPDLAANFNASFLNASVDGRPFYGSGFQMEQLLPLLLGIAPSDADSSVVAKLVHDIAETHTNHSTTGIVGLQATWEVLPKIGRADVGLAMLLKTDYPSFGYSLVNELEPATTIWELYDAPYEGGSMDSRNHVMFATPSYFLFASVAGIQPVKGESVWQVAPATVGVSAEVTSASATVWTVKGQLSAGWKHISASAGSRTAADWEVQINVAVPIGLTVLVSMPTSEATSPEHCTVATASGDAVWRDGSFVPGTAGVASAMCTLTHGKKVITFTTESGNYSFVIKC